MTFQQQTLTLVFESDPDRVISKTFLDLASTSHFVDPFFTEPTGGNVTSAGWQVTLCDLMWHVSSRSGVATFRTAIHLLLYLLTPYKRPRSAHSCRRMCKCLWRIVRLLQLIAIWRICPLFGVPGSIWRQKLCCQLCCTDCIFIIQLFSSYIWHLKNNNRQTVTPALKNRFRHRLNAKRNTAFLYTIGRAGRK